MVMLPMLVNGGNAVMWKSKKASTTATSTTIAEIDAVYHCATECKWMCESLVSLGVKRNNSFKIYCDNQSAVKVLLNTGGKISRPNKS
jgi:hypothetical protein